ncbi:hypothetical protein MKX01_037544 [Papaver californicum]|nr:hypothetical protein MKX01_037544 [Papaver californicum]
MIFLVCTKVKNGNGAISTTTTSSRKNGNAMSSSSSSSADGSRSTNGKGAQYSRNSSITVIDNKTETHHTFDVSFYNDTIRTTVTPVESIVDQWIADVYASFGSKIKEEGSNLIVGLDIEWVRLHETSQRYVVAVLQLCLAHQCLIFQFLGRDKEQVPESLVEFLNDERIVFVGAGIDQDARKLWVDYGLNVARSEDLGSLADYRDNWKNAPKMHAPSGKCPVKFKF